MNTENQSYVADDGLFSSLAQDVEMKCVFQRKAGTGGPIAHCLACSLIGVLLKMRLRVAGEPQKQNVQTLLGTTLAITKDGHHPSLKVDRGYGSEQLLADPSLVKFDTGAVCNTASRNHFLSSMPMDEQKGKWKVNKKFKTGTEPDSGRYELDYGLMVRCLYQYKNQVIDLRDRPGADVRVAKRDIVRERKRPLHLTAYAVQEIHDPKVP